MNWLEAIKALAPIVATIAIPGPAGPVIGGLIAHGIESAEGIPNATGAEKRAHVIDLVNTSVAGINAARPNTLDANLVNQSATSIIDSVVTTANLVKNTPVK